MKVEIHNHKKFRDVSCSLSVSVEGDLNFVSAVLGGMGYSSTSGKDVHQESHISENKPMMGCSKCGIELRRIMMYSCPRGDCTGGLG